MDTKKKQYTAPTLTEQGSVVEKTKGMIGHTYEPWGYQYCDDDELKPPPKP